MFAATNTQRIIQKSTALLLVKMLHMISKPITLTPSIREWRQKHCWRVW